MRFEENSHYSYDERVDLVAKEITDAFPNISKKQAIEIAKLDEPINNQVNNDNKFIRYYYMLLILHNNLELKNIIYQKMQNIINDGLEDNLLFELMDEITKFICNEREDFPIISEIYNN